MNKWIVAGMVILLAASAVADMESKQEDWLRMNALVDSFQLFGSQFALEEDPWAYAESWFKFIDEWNEFSPKFYAAYGNTEEAVTESFRSVERPDGVTVAHNAQSLGWAAHSVDIESRQRAIAEFAGGVGDNRLLRIQQSLEHTPDRVDFRLRLANQAGVVFSLAETLEPGSYAEKLAKAEKLIEEHEAANREAIEATTWPGHNSGFQGPGDPDELAQAALEFLRQNPNWTKPEYDDEHIPYAAAVRGRSWEVEKMIFLTGQPTQYALDMFVAFKGTKDPDIAYVYQMVFYTGEAPGINPGLPFRFANSRQYAKHQMLLKNVPAPE